MKKIWITGFILLTLIFITSGIFSQKQELSETAKNLKSKVEDGNYESILEAAKTGDLTLIPYLEQLSKDEKARDKSNNPAFMAQVALAKLGNNEALQQIIEQVNGQDTALQDLGMKKLGMVGTKPAIRILYKSLGDTNPRKNSECERDYKEFLKNRKEGDAFVGRCSNIYFSKNVVAMSILSKILDNPPTLTLSNDHKVIAIWKEWFKKNKHLID